MLNENMNIPVPQNEPVRAYEPDSNHRRNLQQELNRQISEPVDIPLIIGGREIRTDVMADIRCPHDHSCVLGRYYQAGKAEIESAITASKDAWKDWSRVSWQDRAAIFLKAADMLAGKYRDVLNAATMLGQSKTVYQAEIDSACELIDFWRFNPFFMQQILDIQPIRHAPGTWNTAIWRPLEGFVHAVTPFNFTSIAGNLPTAPAMMGNVVIWKPASTAVLSGYYIMQILKDAGLPDGVINFVPGRGGSVSDIVVDHPDYAGLHFTGSTGVFNTLWKRTADNLHRGVYKSYPRLVGETGGKDFVMAAPDADFESLTAALLRGAFEYQGQKCSAASRAYIPRSIWPELKERLACALEKVVPGDVTDFDTFMGAVINRSAFESIGSYIDRAAASDEADIIIGGKRSSEKGWFIDPTVIHTTNPKSLTMREEIFGPVLTVYVYDDKNLDDTLKLVDQTSPYGLTGAIFATNRSLIRKMSDALTFSAGNFYINDKPTGAVVGQQPFGGARASGTNDKSGSLLNLLRWTNMRVIKESFI
jgi:1-pyrroline-5-carboxylate dehydrogenase